MHYLAQIAQAAKPFLEITLGNILTLLGMLAAMFIGWQKLRDKVDTMNERIQAHEERLESMTSFGMPETCRLHHNKIEVISEAVATQSRTLASIATDINWIKEKLRNNHNS